MTSEGHPEQSVTSDAGATGAQDSPTPPARTRTEVVAPAPAKVRATASVPPAPSQPEAEAAPAAADPEPAAGYSTDQPGSTGGDAADASPAPLVTSPDPAREEGFGPYPPPPATPPSPTSPPAPWGPPVGGPPHAGVWGGAGGWRATNRRAPGGRWAGG